MGYGGVGSGVWVVVRNTTAHGVTRCTSVVVWWCIGGGDEVPSVDV